jgi:hypothetical protein
MMRNWAWLVVPAVVIFLYKTQWEDHVTAKNSQKNEAAKAAQTATLAAAIPQETPLMSKLREEAQNVGQTQDPVAAQKALEDLAAQVTSEDVISLRNKSLDSTVNTDERALTVQVLTLSPLKEAQDALLDIAASQAPERGEDRKNLEEGVLRAQAVEGLKSEESLSEVIKRTSNSFVADRAQRALNHLAKGSPSPKEQDEKALKKVIE